MRAGSRPQRAALGVDPDARDEGAQQLPALLGHERFPDLVEHVEQLGHVLALGAERSAGAETPLEIRDPSSVLVGLALELTEALGEKSATRVDAAEGTEQVLRLGAELGDPRLDPVLGGDQLGLALVPLDQRREDPIAQGAALRQRLHLRDDGGLDVVRVEQARGTAQPLLRGAAAVVAVALLLVVVGVARAHRRVAGQTAEQARQQRLAPSRASRAGSCRAQRVRCTRSKTSGSMMGSCSPRKRSSLWRTLPTRAGAEQPVHGVLVERGAMRRAVLGHARPKREPARVEPLCRERHREGALVEVEGELHHGGLLGYDLERAALAVDAVSCARPRRAVSASGRSSGARPARPPP